MKVLLLGKFPPGQGGISAKTYWLFRSLVRLGFEFDVVTLVPPQYSTLEKAELPSGVRVTTLETAPDGPWFIPGGRLATERLVAAALRICEDTMPDLVECNYLAPYGLASVVISRLIERPLLVRHAGSDIAKLLGWDQTRAALEAVLYAADLVATNQDACRIVARHSSRFVVLPRYIPDPGAFGNRMPPTRDKVLLWLGKLNYHWCLKALDTLLAVLEQRPDWRLVVVADGIARSAFEATVREHRLNDRVALGPFEPPDRIPAILRSATAIWAVERRGDVSDFSNVVWETVASGRHCLVSPSVFDHPDAEAFRSNPLLVPVEPEDPATVVAALDSIAVGLGATPDSLNWVELYEDYVSRNAKAYANLAHGQKTPSEVP